MRLGVCCTPEQATFAKEVGADYVELPAGPLFSEPSYFHKLADLKPETTNLFFPPGTALYDNEDLSFKIGSMILDGAAEAGVKLCVVGSGAARKAPEGKEPSWAQEEFVGLIAALKSHADKLGIAIAPESLNRSECDVGTRLRELSLELQERGVGYTADSYHVLKEWDYDSRPRTLEEEMKREIPHAPLHAHLGGLDRTPPLSDDLMILSFFARLKELGYDGRVSIEVNWHDFETELQLALESTRMMWEKA